MGRRILSYGAARRAIIFFSFILLLAQAEDINADIQSLGLLIVDFLVAVSLLFVVGLLTKAKKKPERIIIDAVIVLLAFGLSLEIFVIFVMDANINYPAVALLMFAIMMINAFLGR
ncbi:hypothetical protein M1394_00025 [Candidatus Marsarchaeota archaeon]|nr:hypothetical protein [Candidatus Marsarchaeota archaeon]